MVDPGTAVDAPPCRFRVTTPATWFDLDLAPATRRRSAERMVARRLPSGPRYATLRRELAGVLERSSADAVRRGAVWASIYSAVIDGTPVSASLVASIAGGGELGGQAVELPAGRAVRLRSRRTAAVEGRPAVVESLQYALPVPGTDLQLVLTFTTPSLFVAEAFAALFDAIAASLAWE